MRTRRAPSYMFVPVNSGSLPQDLLESTLFGHVKGAFTSAIQTRKGYFEVANHGTIFFDEIGTIGPETQAKLLRVIQEKEFQPLGSNDTIKVDVRILAATNDDLRKLVDEGRFRQDLYYRLNVINIALPPLRERKEDIPPLVDFFFTKYCRENQKFLDGSNRSILHFQPEAMQILMDHNWPGNVRELENVVERAVVLAAEPAVPLDVFPDNLLQASGIRLRRGDGGPLPADASLFEIVADFERRIIIEAPGEGQLEPDRSRGKFACSAFDAQSEDQAVEHRDPAQVREHPRGRAHGAASLTCLRRVLADGNHTTGRSEAAERGREAAPHRRARAVRVPKGAYRGRRADSDALHSQGAGAVRRGREPDRGVLPSWHAQPAGGRLAAGAGNWELQQHGRRNRPLES